MYGKLYGGWLKAGMDAWSLGAEASAVIALRMAKLGATRKTLSHYRRKVGANRRRLSR